MCISGECHEHLLEIRKKTCPQTGKMWKEGWATLPMHDGFQEKYIYHTLIQIQLPKARHFSPLSSALGDLLCKEDQLLKWLMCFCWGTTNSLGTLTKISLNTTRAPLPAHWVHQPRQSVTQQWAANIAGHGATELHYGNISGKVLIWKHSLLLVSHRKEMVYFHALYFKWMPLEGPRVQLMALSSLTWAPDTPALWALFKQSREPLLCAC